MLPYTHTHFPLRTHTRNSTPMSTFERPSQQILEIDEVTTVVSLSRGTTETIAPVKF
jgi:hypothetical protein